MVSNQLICIIAAVFAADGVVGLFWGRKFQGVMKSVNVRRLALIELLAAVILLCVMAYTRSAS